MLVNIISLFVSSRQIKTKHHLKKDENELTNRHVCENLPVQSMKVNTGYLHA